MQLLIKTYSTIIGSNQCKTGDRLMNLPYSTQYRHAAFCQPIQPTDQDRRSHTQVGGRHPGEHTDTRTSRHTNMYGHTRTHTDTHEHTREHSSAHVYMGARCAGAQNTTEKEGDG